MKHINCYVRYIPSGEVGIIAGGSYNVSDVRYIMSTGDICTVATYDSDLQRISEEEYREALERKFEDKSKPIVSNNAAMPDSLIINGVTYIKKAD